jgi:peptidoglycan hydrolase-like amidase
MKNKKTKISFWTALFLLILVIISAKLLASTLPTLSLHDYTIKDSLFSLAKIVPTAQAAEKKAEVYSAELISSNPSGLIKINSGQELTIKLQYKNTGNVTWQRDVFNFTAIATVNPIMHDSQFKQSAWEESFRPTKLDEKTVAPGKTGTFTFKIKAPKKTGTYNESFSLVVRRIAWIDNSQVNFKIEVTSQTVSAGSQTTSVQKTTTPANNQKTTTNIKTVVATKDYFTLPNTKQIANLKNDTEKLKKKNTIILVAEDATIPTSDPIIQNQISSSDANTVTDTKQSAITNVGPTIRVGLFATTTPQIITANKDFLIKLSDGVTLGQQHAQQTVTLSYDTASGIYHVDNGSLNYSGTKWPILEGKEANTIFEVKTLDNRLAWAPSINDNTFRQKLELHYAKDTNRVWLINELPMEQYIKGVAEVTNASPYEYLKAMAIAIRTYTYYHYNKGVINGVPDGSGKHASEHFHVDSLYDEVYRGYNSEMRLANFAKAVDETQGTILTYENKVAITPYFSRSDGRTRSFKEVWGYDVPWLISVPTPYTANNTLYGHGVGMDCTDAYRRADNAGTAYDQILKYYYTGVSLYKQY